MIFLKAVFPFLDLIFIVFFFMIFVLVFKNGQNKKGFSNILMVYFIITMLLSSIFILIYPSISDSSIVYEWVYQRPIRSLCMPLIFFLSTLVTIFPINLLLENSNFDYSEKYKFYIIFILVIFVCYIVVKSNDLMTLSVFIVVLNILFFIMLFTDKTIVNSVDEKLIFLKFSVILLMLLLCILWFLYKVFGTFELKTLCHILENDEILLISIFDSLTKLFLIILIFILLFLSVGTVPIYFWVSYNCFEKCHVTLKITFLHFSKFVFLCTSYKLSCLVIPIVKVLPLVFPFIYFFLMVILSYYTLLYSQKKFIFFLGYNLFAMGPIMMYIYLLQDKIFGFKYFFIFILFYELVSITFFCLFAIFKVFKINSEKLDINIKAFLIYIDFVHYTNALIYFISFVVSVCYGELMLVILDSGYSIVRLYVFKIYVIMFSITIVYLCYSLIFKLELNAIIKKSVNLQYLTVFFILITNLIILGYFLQNLNSILTFLGYIIGS